MGEKVTIEQSSEGEYLVTGLLSLRTINKLRVSADRIITEEDGPFRIDLSGAVTNGTAGLALLSSLVRTARKAGKELVFINPPASLLTLAEANGLSRLLSLNT